MNTPPLLLGAALLFWGWQTGLLIIAVIMAIILEGSRLVNHRFAFSQNDVNRFSDLGTIIVLGLFIYLITANRTAQSLLTLIMWLPLPMLPLFIAQVYGTKEKIDISALFLLFRKKGDRSQPVTLNLSYPYFALCILSASAANSRTVVFYIGLFILVTWALWSKRSRRFPLILWLVLLLFSGAIGYIGQLGLHRLQLNLEQMAITAFTDLFSKESDPYKIRTSIGEVGRLKLSDKIVLRVWPEDYSRQTLLLLESSYKTYRNSMWFAPRTLFEIINPEADRSSWKINNDEDKGGKTITISQTLKNGRGMMRLPLNACEITNFPVMKLMKNQYGAFKVEGGPDFINFNVRIGERSKLDVLPDEGDLHIPSEEKEAIMKIMQELDLKSDSPKDRLMKLLHYFQNNFSYTLDLNEQHAGATPLADFLLSSKKGHCEFFATATVLLLRATKIPARYAVGYSVNEFSEFEDCFLVRARHAHAWTLVYYDGEWHNFDTTPVSWVTEEEENASLFEPFTDLISYTLYKFKEWRWSEKEDWPTRYIGWLLIPLVLFILKKFHSKKRLKGEVKIEEDNKVMDIRRGTDSAFFLIEEKLAKAGFKRRKSETCTDWLARIDTSLGESVSAESIKTILDLHYRYRFDPKGLTNYEKLLLKNNVSLWLQRYKEILHC